MLNKLTALGLFITILIPSGFAVYAEVAGMTEDQMNWDVLVALISLGIFLNVPLAITRLLRK